MSPTRTSDVLVIGAGPTGLMLASELALAGVRCRVLERRAETSNITRAFAVHARTLELLDARGLAYDLLPRGVPVREIAPTPGTTVDLTDALQQILVDAAVGILEAGHGGRSSPRQKPRGAVAATGTDNHTDHIEQP